ncbi:MAG: hypothetical protein ACRC8A_06520 [Microcoleaceae cyanobacterium]
MQLSPTLIERVILSALITVLASIPLTQTKTQAEVAPSHESHLTAYHAGTLSLPLLKF